MVGGVTGDELVQQGRREVGGEASHKTGAGAHEVGLNVVKTAAIAPQRVGVDGFPGVVDVAESQTLGVREVVVHANQLFAPGGGQRFIAGIDGDRLTRGLAC